MSNYNTTLQSNNIDLQSILNAINELPNATVQATPSITVNSSGLITATAGTKSATKQLAFQPAKTITPSTADQIAVSSGYYTGGNITVKGDSNLVADNIKSGVSIFGVTGTNSGNAMQVVTGTFTTGTTKLTSSGLTVNGLGITPTILYIYLESEISGSNSTNQFYMGTIYNKELNIHTNIRMRISNGYLSFYHDDRINDEIANLYSVIAVRDDYFIISSLNSKTIYFREGTYRYIAIG